MSDWTQEEDAALLRRAARGDTEAFAVLYDRLSPMVLLRLRRRCDDAELVSDLVQETFTAVWRHASAWDGRGEVGGWVWTIAARRLIDAYRRRAARGLHLLKATDDVADDAAVSPSAEEQVLDGLLAGPLEAAMRELSPRLREVLEATVLDGLSTREAALLLGIPEGTVKARAFRARSALRQALA